MSPAEVAWRVREQAMRRTWSRRQVRQDQVASLRPLPPRHRRFTSILPPGPAAGTPEHARKAIISDATRLLRGEWEMLGVARNDMAKPDWFCDPVTGRRSEPAKHAFGLPHRDETQVGNIKQVWEVNRLQHLTLLATAWYLTHEDAYAQRVAGQLQSWWQENPFLSGINWTSGIELGVRLINFVWIRRLLDGWPGVADLFEGNQLALHQIHWHQQYLAAFESRGSSANNHVIAEAAGQLAACCAFPWFGESDRWRRGAVRLLERELEHNTFPSGVNKELASDYHGFVAELGLLAAVEADAADCPLSAATWRRLAAMADAMAALVDEKGQPPRQGDSDEGRVVLLDAPEHNRWPTVLALSDALFGRLDWWPSITPDAGSVLAGALIGDKREIGARAPRRPSRFEDAGIAILRTDEADYPEIWCRCDGGPHGFLSIAAHAHADALSVELRYGGIDILADPGTYCYHGEPAWRSYFRSTIAHNTVEIAGCSQSVDVGPFMWLRHARTWAIDVPDPDHNWIAAHDGYALLTPPARHQRSVRLDPEARAIEITDEIDTAGHDVRMAFHFGPLVQARLSGGGADLAWPHAPVSGSARMQLPAELDWRLHHGETEPIAGWYSPELGRREPAAALVGTGRAQRSLLLITRVEFADDAAFHGPDTGDDLVTQAGSGRTSDGEDTIIPSDLHTEGT
jgi:hypothetical protein